MVVTHETVTGWQVANRLASMFIWLLASVIVVTLRKIRDGGHKMLFLNLAILASIQSVLYGVRLVGMVLPVSRWVFNTLISAACFAVIWVSLYLVASWGDIRQTVKDSEWANKLRKNRDDDREQIRMNLLSEARLSLTATEEFTAQYRAAITQ